LPGGYFHITKDKRRCRSHKTTQKINIHQGVLIVDLVINFINMSTSVIIIVGVLALIFLVFLIIRNQKDKKEVIEQMKNDYPKSKDEEGDADVDNKSQMH
jgi:hypothetical protein